MKIIALSGLTSHVGCSSVCAALAYSMSMLTKFCLCTEARFNLDRPTLSPFFGVEDSDCGYLKARKNHLEFDSQELKSPILFKVSDTLYYLNQGTLEDSNNQEISFEQHNAQDLASSLIDSLHKNTALDFAFIDVGTVDNDFKKTLVEKADVDLTIIEADSNCLVRLNNATLRNRQLLLINKVIQSSQSMNNVVLLLQNSKLKDKILNAEICFDESVLSANLNQAPFTRFFPVSSSTDDIERLCFEIIELCHKKDLFGDESKNTLTDSLNQDQNSLTVNNLTVNTEAQHS